MLRADIQITDQDARVVMPIKGNEYRGQRANTLDGRTYAYSIAGAVDLAAGKLNTPAATTTNHVNQTGTANVVGTTQLTWTLGATAATANQYAGGYLSVNDGPGVNVYRIKSNTAALSAGSITVTLESDEGLTVATTTSSKFSLYPGPFSSTVVSTGATSALQANGVSNVLVPATYSYWSQVAGYAAVLSDGIIAKNTSAIVSPSVAGAAVTDGTSGILERIGFAPEATVDAKYYPLVLTIEY